MCSYVFTSSGCIQRVIHKLSFSVNSLILITLKLWQIHSLPVHVVICNLLLPPAEVHVAKQQVGDFRLFGNRSDGVGAVEIFTDLGWSGICPDSKWTISAAKVFCQLLGYDFGKAVTFQ